MSQPDNSQLLRFITDNFGLEDLKTLCFNLGVEFDDLGGEGREAKARELVKWLQNRSRLDHLIAHLSLARPEQYRQHFHETPFIPPTPARLRRDPRQVFISHAHQDGALAQKLARDLQARGYPIWIAPDNIRIGEDWPDAIDRGLDESGVVVVALTPAAITSYWVRKETSAARLLEGRGLARLVLLDVAECDLPSSWLTYQFANFRDDYAAGLNQLLQALDGAPTPAAPVETGRRPVSSLPADSSAETGRRPVSTTSPDRRIHAQTSIELIRIPAGPFLYGSTDDNELAFKDQKPQRVVDLPEFWIGRTPITNAQFARFVAATDYRTSTQLRGGQWAQLGNEKGSEILGIDWQHPQGPGSSLAGKDDHPVTFISWYDAQAFCDWARLALPQQEQWEKAARGTDGRLWPWGNEPPTEERCNFDSFDTTPVGLFSPQGDSPYGCVDMIGNVWEWTASVLWRWPPIRYGLRGGAYYNDMAFVLNPAYRWDSEPEDGGQGYGFRVIERIADGDF